MGGVRDWLKLDTMRFPKNLECEVAHFGGRRYGFFYDAPYFLFHRYAMLRGAESEFGDDFVVEFPDADIGHVGSLREVY